MKTMYKRFLQVFPVLFMLLFCSLNVKAADDVVSGGKTYSITYHTNSGYWEETRNYSLHHDYPVFAYLYDGFNDGVPEIFFLTVGDIYTSSGMIELSCEGTSSGNQPGSSSVTVKDLTSFKVFAVSSVGLPNMSAMTSAHILYWDSYNFNFPLFDSLDSLKNHVSSDYTDYSGCLNLEQFDSSGSGTGGPVTDDMLEGIWGGIVDQEVVLEEDDGTVLGAIRTWIKNLGNMFSSPLTTIKNLIKKIPLSTITVLEGSNFFDKILQLVNDVNSLKYDLFENFKETGPGEMLFEIVDAVNTFKLQLFDNFAESELGKTLFGIVDSVNGFKLQLFDNFAESELGKKLIEIGDYIYGLPGEFIRFLKESDFGDLLDLVNTVNNLKTEIPKSIMEYLGDKLELLFVPDKANLEARVTSIREEFAFVDSLFEAGKHILNTLEASTGRSAPVITVDLSKYSGSHYWGNQKVVIDFSWYAPYKESVDIVIASIIWVTWLWSVWKRLPDIIAGAGMVTDVQNMSADMERGYRIKPKSDFIIIPRGKKK